MIGAALEGVAPFSYRVWKEIPTHGRDAQVFFDGRLRLEGSDFAARISSSCLENKQPLNAGGTAQD